MSCDGYCGSQNCLNSICQGREYAACAHCSGTGKRWKVDHDNENSWQICSRCKGHGRVRPAVANKNSQRSFTGTWKEWLAAHGSIQADKVVLSDKPVLLYHPQGDTTVYGFFDGGKSWMIHDKSYVALIDVIDGLLKMQWPDIEFTFPGVDGQNVC